MITETFSFGKYAASINVSQYYDRYIGSGIFMLIWNDMTYMYACILLLVYCQETMIVDCVSVID